MQGYESSAGRDGTCMPRWIPDESVALAEYRGQSVTCTPQTNADGTVAQSFCRQGQLEAIRACCRDTPSCTIGSVPTNCTLKCAKIWLPLQEKCFRYMAANQTFTASCEAQAAELLKGAP